MDRGLTSAYAREKLKEFGKNEIEIKKSYNALSIFLSQFPTFINGILFAEGKIVLSHHLEVDESVLTGESIPVAKISFDLAFSGTLVSKGRGRLLVENTGMNTRFGKIAGTLSSIETEKTPLQKSLSSLGKIISIVAIIIAFSLIPIRLTQGRNLFDLVLLSVSAGVAAIPEG